MSEKWKAAIDGVENLKQQRAEEVRDELRQKGKTFAWLVEFLESKEGMQAQELLAAALLVNKLRAWGREIPCVVNIFGKDGEKIFLSKDGVIYREREEYPSLTSDTATTLMNSEFRERALSPLHAAALLSQKESDYKPSTMFAYLDYLAEEVSKRSGV